MEKKITDDSSFGHSRGYACTNFLDQKHPVYIHIGYSRADKPCTRACRYEKQRWILRDAKRSSRIRVRSDSRDRDSRAVAAIVVQQPTGTADGTG
jgi:hypothetical protein